MDEITIRDASHGDLERVLEIYTPYITDSVISFEEVPPSLEEMKERFQKVRVLNFPYFVLCKNDHIIGYGYIKPYHDRAAYRFTGEHSIYLDRSEKSNGYGQKLLKQLIEAAKSIGLQKLIAVIAGNEPHASHKIHEKFGFQKVGTIQKCGYKFDQWVDVTYMQKDLA